MMLVSLVSQAQGKSTMEMLINKDWHELNFQTMKAHDNFYIRYTGTQRMIVGVDSDGNTKARVQYYYLSDSVAEKFDSSKIGKVRNGIYIVLQNNINTESGVSCLEIKSLQEESLQTVSTNHLEQTVKYYFTEIKEEQEKSGDIIPTIDLLADKIWYQIDNETGKRTGVEFTYGYSAYFKCTMPENRYEEFPKWERREFYLSDTVVTDFDRSLVTKRLNGIYLVVNDLNEYGEWQTITYDISTLSDDRLVLESIYPKGLPTLVFENNMGKNRNIVKKPQQNQLIGCEWFRLDTMSWERSNYSETYDRTHVTRMIRRKTRDSVRIERRTYEYYMSNQPVEEFDWSQKGKRLEGDYVVVNEPDSRGDYRAVNYRISIIEGRNMIMENVSASDSIMYVYENAEAELEKNGVDSVEKASTMIDLLVGKQWLLVLDNGKKSLVQPIYYTKSQFAIPKWHAIDGGYDMEMEVFEYCLANNPHFDYSNKANGKFINHFGSRTYSRHSDNSRASGHGIRHSSLKHDPNDGFRKAFSRKILYISDKLLILETVATNRNGLYVRPVHFVSY